MPIHDAKGVPPFLIFDCISLHRLRLAYALLEERSKSENSLASIGFARPAIPLLRAAVSGIPICERLARFVAGLLLDEWEQA